VVGRPALARISTLGAVAVVVVTGAWLQFQFGGPRVTEASDDLVEWAAAWLAAGSCLWAWRRGEPQLRGLWAFVGSAALAWGAGEAVWTYYEVGLGRHVPFPSLADVGFLAAVPLIVAALLAFPLAPLGSVGRVRALLDGALVASATLFVSWATVLGPMYRTHQGGRFTQALSLAYPLGDLVIVVVVLCVAASAARQNWVALGFVGGGVLAMAVSDSMFAYLSQSSQYGVGNTLDVGWTAGFLSIALAPIWSRNMSVLPSPADRPSRLGVLVPYVPAVGALSLAVLRWTRHQHLEPFLVGNGVVLVLVLVCRQWLALFDNVSLSHRLAAKAAVQGRELERQDARFAALVQRSTDLTTIVSADGTIVYQSPSSLALLGWPPAELNGRSFREIVHADDAPAWLRALSQLTRNPAGETTTDWRLRHKDGRYVHAESRVANLLDDPNIDGIVINSRDVSERKRLENELRHQAVHDPLTGLPNRTLLYDRIEHALALHRREQRNLAVLFLDLDDFKSVNDRLGHAAGDEMLREVARRLQSVVREADTVARLGGDEFAVVLDGTLTAADAVDTADRILDVFKTPFVLTGSEAFGHASIGISVTDGDAVDAAGLLQEADIAMYAAKASGKGRRETYRQGMHERVIDDLHLAADLQHALQHGELAVLYQPIVALSTGTMSGVEALMRWHHRTRGLITPNAFIHLAESSGLIVPMGRWLLGQACRDIRSWRDLGAGPRLQLSINLSARQLEDSQLVSDVASALSQSQLEPSQLTLEITETVLMSNLDSSRSILNELKALGVRLAIDDFGTGYSSLSYLRQLPVDELKIDRSFISAMSESEASASLVRTILKLAEDFQLTTVAEGVETADQLEALRADSCELGQGYLFARPQPEEQLRRGLQNGELSWQRQVHADSPPDRAGSEVAAGVARSR
jgi:diguanylate cyclase (GGDEF)-like protein/PAS domain S-box-containing protein